MQLPSNVEVYKDEQGWWAYAHDGTTRFWNGDPLGPFPSEGYAKAAIQQNWDELNGIPYDDSKVYEYTCTLQRADGSTYDDLLSAVSDTHAFEEAMYEFDDECIAVKRGEFLYNND